MSRAAEELVERFDLEWDLGLDFDGLRGALRPLDIDAIDVRSGLASLDAADQLTVVRCVLDMCDRLYDLDTASVWEPILLELVLSPVATGEHAARGWDALGRISYRRGEYVTAAERFGSALAHAQEAGLEWLRADLTSNWLRADDERVRLTRPQVGVERLHRYEEALTLATHDAPDVVAARSTGDRRAMIEARGISNLYHNLAVILRVNGQLERALTCHREARAINETLGDRYRLGQTLLNEALVHEAMFRASREPADLDRGVELLHRLRDDQGWPRGRCFALQNLARISHEHRGDREAANNLYIAAWRTYSEIAGRKARDTAFEEWQLRDWVNVTPEPELPDRFRTAYETFHRMRGNLRHVLFKRNYAQRVVRVLERGLPYIDEAAEAAGYLGNWSAQEIADLTQLVEQIDHQFAHADFTEFDRPVSEAMLGRRRKATDPTGRMDLDEDTLTALTPSLHARHGEYVRRIERARLHAPRSTPWNVARLQYVLPPDAAAVAYFWPREGAPSAYVVTRADVRTAPLRPGSLEFDTSIGVRPSNRLCRQLHDHLVEPWLDHLLDSGVRSLYLVPYDSLFRLPIHCAQPDIDAPILLRHPGLDRVLYSVSLKELTEALDVEVGARFGPYGDAVRARDGLAVLDPAGDLSVAGSAAIDRLMNTVRRLREEGRVSILASSTATHRNVLEGLKSAGWWFHLGHGNVPLSPAENERVRREARALQEESQIGAMLELADGILEDLDILLRCQTRALEFCLLSACVSVGMDISAGNEIAGFLRALKVRRCGPTALAFWMISRDLGAVVMDQLLRILHLRPDPIGLCAALAAALDEAEQLSAPLGRAQPSSGMFGIYV